MIRFQRRIIQAHWPLDCYLVQNFNITSFLQKTRMLIPIFANAATRRPCVILHGSTIFWNLGQVFSFLTRDHFGTNSKQKERIARYFTHVYVNVKSVSSCCGTVFPRLQGQIGFTLRDTSKRLASGSPQAWVKRAAISLGVNRNVTETQISGWISSISRAVILDWSKLVISVRKPLSSGDRQGGYESCCVVRFLLVSNSSLVEARGLTRRRLSRRVIISCFSRVWLCAALPNLFKSHTAKRRRDFQTEKNYAQFATFDLITVQNVGFLRQDTLLALGPIFTLHWQNSVSQVFHQ